MSEITFQISKLAEQASADQWKLEQRIVLLTNMHASVQAMLDALHIEHAQLLRERNKLIEERDEVRRWLCQRLEWDTGGDGTDAAKERGWDCFNGQIYD